MTVKNVEPNEFASASRPAAEAEPRPREFHFWRIMIFCWAVVAMCGFVAWVVSTYFY